MSRTAIPPGANATGLASGVDDPRVVQAAEEYADLLRAGEPIDRAAFLARHADIVPVYGVGCERGVHYYAMQLIEGVTLAEVVRGARSEKADGTGAYVPADAAERVSVAGLCEAGPGSQTPATEDPGTRPYPAD